MAAKTVHLTSLGFFGAALVFYILGAITPVIAFSVIGCFVEFVGWIAMLGESEDKDNS